MKQIEIKSYAKINLSIDIKGVNSDGYHEVEMIMQQVALHDKVKILWQSDANGRDNKKRIELKTNKYYLPVDERNLAYKAALIMSERYGKELAGGVIRIDIKKVIPVAAGLAGGSGNAAAVILGLNNIWNIGLTLDQMCEIGAELGADIPFSIRGQAKANWNLGKKLNSDRGAYSCAFATGTGTVLKRVESLDSYMLLVKPPFSVSTREVYSKIDDCKITARPNNEMLIRYLKTGYYTGIYECMENVLEAYTLKAYPAVKKIKEQIEDLTKPKFCMMSGSGPTIYALYASRYKAMMACEKIRALGYEAYWTKTMR